MTADKYQDFFNFMNQEHGLILTIEEMDEIVSESQKLIDKFNKCKCDFPLIRTGENGEYCGKCELNI